MQQKRPEDIILWNDFKKGDDKAFSLIYFQHAKVLYQYGTKFTSNYSLIEDAIQDLFIDLMNNRKSIGPTDNIRFYLLKSFRRKLLRSVQKESRYGDDQVHEFYFGTKISVEEEFINREISNEKQQSLKQAIDGLSPRQKEAIFLRFQKGLTYNEIAELLSIGVDASRNLIFRAVKSIKEAVFVSGFNQSLLFIFRKITSI